MTANLCFVRRVVGTAPFCGYRYEEHLLHILVAGQYRGAGAVKSEQKAR